MAVLNPNLHLATNQGGYRLCWETNDVKHLLKSMSTDCDKPSLQTSTGTDTPITSTVGALWVATSFFVRLYSKEALEQTSCRQGGWDAERWNGQTGQN